MTTHVKYYRSAFTAPFPNGLGYWEKEITVEYPMNKGQAESLVAERMISRWLIHEFAMIVRLSFGKDLVRPKIQEELVDLQVGPCYAL